MIDIAAAGAIDKQIASEMGISLGTIRVYWKRLRKKHGNATRAEVLVAYGQAKTDVPLNDDLVQEVRDSLAELRKAFPDDCQTARSLRFRLAVDALLGGNS